MRLRDESGQGSIEYAGALALIAIVFGVLAATDVPAKVRGAVGPAVCRMLGTDCGTTAAASTPPAAAKPAGDQPPSPINFDTPFPVLPFPGSYEVACAYGSGCDPGKGVSVGHKAGMTVERSPTTLDDEGCPQTQLGVKGTLELVANAKGETAKAGGTMTGVVGSATGYSVTVPPDQVDRIAAGDRSAPNPVDPRTIRQDESVELSEEFYAGARMEANYRQLQVEMGYEKGRKVSAGVERVSPSTVRISVGDKDFVRDALSLGAGEGPVSVAVARGRELSDGGLRQVDVDISTQAGWKAYQSFLTSGRIPKDGAPGTSGASKSKVVEYKDQTSIKGTFGDHALSRILSESGSTGIETRKADGTVENSFTGHVNDVGVVVVTETKPGGKPTPKQYSLTLENVDPKVIERYESDTGLKLARGPGDTLRFDFKPEDFDQMRSQAFDQVMHSMKQDNPELTEAQVREIMADGGDEFSNPVNSTNDNAFEVATGTDDEILEQLYLGSGPNRDPNLALDGLLDFQNRTIAAQGGERGDLVSEHPEARLPGSVPASC